MAEEEERRRYTIWVEYPGPPEEYEVEVPRREVIERELERLRREGLVEVRRTPEGLRVVAKSPTARERVTALLSRMGARRVVRRVERPVRRLLGELAPSRALSTWWSRYIPTARVGRNAAYGLAAALVAAGVASADKWAYESLGILGVAFDLPFSLVHAAMYFVFALAASTALSIPMTIFYNSYRGARGLSVRAMLFGMLTAVMASAASRSWLYALSAYALGGVYALILYLLVTVGSALAGLLPAVLTLAMGAGIIVAILVAAVIAVLAPYVAAGLAGLIVATVAGVAAALAAAFLMRVSYAWLTMMAYLFILARLYMPWAAYAAAAFFVVYAGIRAAAGDMRSLNALPAVLLMLAMPEAWLLWLDLEDLAWQAWHAYAEWLGYPPSTEAARLIVEWILSKIPPWVTRG